MAERQDEKGHDREPDQKHDPADDGDDDEPGLALSALLLVILFTEDLAHEPNEK